MYDENSKGLSYMSGFFMLIAFAVAGLVFSSLLSKPIWEAMTGEKFEVFIKGVVKPSYANAYKVIQSITAIFSCLLPAILTAFLLNRKPLRLLGFSPQVKPNQVGLTILIILVALFISTSLAYFNQSLPIPADWKIEFEKMESNYMQRVEGIISLKSSTDFIIALFVMAFLPALCEETLFRGGLQNFLTRGTGKFWLSIIIVSLIFSAVHWSFYGFLSRFFLGMTLGLIYQYSGKLWLSILAHFVNNALALSVLYYTTLEGKSMTEITREANSNWWGIFILPLFVGLVVYFRKISAPSTEQSNT